ncbi:class I adenylate-forming enzyme family protein [Microtetraspora fusca]|uniref:class I adenylate-forming enzyme family protein n=1 Tax=Microtetraspora fusca TaxID=1997 RepID=UPI00082B1E5F|nr:class I adenylate-forming enzyme family protein [Microtetraspora fusca]
MKTALETPVLPALLAARAAAEPGKVAMIVHGAGELTFEEWERRSNEVANALLSMGIGRGERIGLIFPAGRWIDYAIAFLGVLKAGAVAVPLADRTPAAEVARIAAHCSISMTIGELADLPRASAEPPGLPNDPDAVAQILYTSGTTGTAKGVAATHANLAFGAVLNPRRPGMRMFAHSRHLVHAFPIGTNAGQMMLVNALNAHPAVVTLPRFTPDRFARLIADHRAGTVFLVPAMAVELLGRREDHDLSSVQLLGSAAAPLPAAVATRLAGMFPNATIANYYTSTEAAPAQTIMIVDPERPGSVGRAAAGGAVRIASPEGEAVRAGETGEVWMRSPAAPRSYYNDTDAASDVFRGGWIRMGDLGYIDEDGYLYLVDRESDVIKSGAFKVSTLKVEEALHAHPAVAEAAAYGVPHPVLGMAVAAAVVLRSPGPDQAIGGGLGTDEADGRHEGAPDDGEVSLAALRAFLAERLARHEIPSQIATMDALPRNAGGKVDKRALRART